MTQIRCEVKGVFVAMSDGATVPLVVLTDGDEPFTCRYLSGSGRQYPSIAQKSKKSCPDHSPTISFSICLKNFPSRCALSSDRQHRGWCLIMPSSYSRQITTRSISTAVQATALRLHSGEMSPYLLMKPYLHQQGRKQRIFQRWLTCQRFSEIRGVYFWFL